MSDRLEVVITGKDGISRVFKEVTSGARTTGAAIEAAGKKGAAGLKENERAATSLSTRMAALGGTAATVAGFLSDAGRASEESAQIQRQLEQAIANTGESYAQYADQIDAAGARAVQLGIDDEKAAQALQALTESTGSAQIALNDLGLVQDIAAAKGMDLVTAAELVGKVHNGNVGILARYGISVRDGATAEEALAQIQQQVAGQAEAHASTIDRMTVQYGNLVESVGGALGQFAPLVGMLPGLSVGFSAVGTAVGALAPNLTKAGVASAALDLALGPVGIVAAAGLAGVAIYELAQRFDDANLSAKEAEGQITSFDDALATLGKAGADQSALQGLGSYRQTLVDLAAASKSASDTIAFTYAEAAQADSAYQEAVVNGNKEAADAARARGEALRENIKILDGAIITEEQFSEVQKDLVDIFQDMNPLNADLVIARLAELKGQLDSGVISADEFVSAVDDLNEHSDSYGLTLEQLTGTAQKTASEIRELASAQAELAFATGATEDKNKTLTDANNALITSYEDTAAGAKLLADLQLIAAEGTEAQRKSVFELFALYQTGTDTNNLYVNTVTFIANSLRAQTAAADAATAAMAKQTVGYYSNAAGSHAVSEALKDHIAQQKAAADLLAASTPQAIEDQKQLNVHGERWAALAEQGVWDQSGQLIGTKKGMEAAEAATRAAADAARGYAEALVGTISLAANLRPLDIGFKGGDKVTGTAAELQGAGSALTAVLNVFQQIDNLGKGHDQAGGIVENLIGTPDKAGVALSLLEQGRISQTRFNMTVEAGNAILARSEEIERDLNVTRAKQLPLLNQADQRYAALIDDISHMSAEQATATLGFMDQTEAMKAQNAVALAAAAAQSEVGSTARKATEEIIAGQIATDPVLEQMLTQIGLVARDHEGNLVINFDNADSLNKSTDALTVAINALTAALNDVPPYVQTEITAIDNASGTLDSIATLMEAVDRDISTTVTTTFIKNGDGTSTPSTGGSWRGGIPLDYPAYARGGMVEARLAEAGGELVTFAGGGVAYARNDGIYSLPSNSYVHTAPQTRQMLEGIGGNVHVEFNNYAPVNNRSDVDDIVAEIERLVRAKFRGLGVG